jgi:hypothetical protein
MSSSCGERGSLWLAFAAAARKEEAAVDAAIAGDYHRRLSTPALVAEVRRLLFTERQAGRLVCRYLADLADRIHERQDGELTAYVDEFQAAGCFFDLGPRDTRERVRIGRALRNLPQIEAAFIAGNLCYSRVREVTRVARPETQAAWLELARSLDMRSLERRVAGVVEEPHSTRKGSSLETGAVEAALAAQSIELGADEPRPRAAVLLSTAFGAPGAMPPPAPSDAATTDGPTAGRTSAPANARTEWLARDALRVTFTLSVEAWALLERAIERVRHRAETPLSDAEALEAIARDALAAREHAADASGPRCAVSVHECEVCGRSAVDTGVGPFEHGVVAANRACRSRELRRESEGRRVETGGSLPAATGRSALLRDRSRCGVLRGTRSVDLGAHCPSSECRHSGSPSEAVSNEAAVDDTVTLGSAVDDTTAEPTPSETATHVGNSNDLAARLLRIIGRRGNWTPDELGQQSGLRVPELQHALLLLELDGRVRRRGGLVDPV